MQFFIGIAPYEEYKKKIVAFQEQWGTNGTEPHITVKAQSGLVSEMSWLEVVTNVCKNVKPFYVTLGEPKFFGEFVLYLSVDSEGIVDLHRNLVKAVDPSPELIKRYFELEDYVPHLTLGQTAHGLKYEVLIEMYSKTKEKLSPYPKYLVDFVRVYKQEQPGEYYKKYLDIPLRG
ncbi:MAG: 2'-5' RNA ligase family protein [Bacillota bacterium]